MEEVRVRKRHQEPAAMWHPPRALHDAGRGANRERQTPGQNTERVAMDIGSLEQTEVSLFVHGSSTPSIQVDTLNSLPCPVNCEEHSWNDWGHETHSTQLPPPQRGSARNEGAEETRHHACLDMLVSACDLACCCLVLGFIRHISLLLPICPRLVFPSVLDRTRP